MSMPGDDPSIGVTVEVVTGEHEGDTGTIVSRSMIEGVMKYGVELAWGYGQPPFYFTEKELRFV